MDLEPKRYQVFWEDQRVLDIVNEPGPLISKLAPPPRPGEGPVLHPFLSAVAHVPEHEEILREVLDRSTSIDDYLTRLREMGYRVLAVEPEGA